MSSRIILVFAFASLLSSCFLKRSTGEDYEFPNFVLDLDTTEITPQVEIRRASKAKVHDLIHTRLDVRFDWRNKHLIGSAELTLKPWLYPSNRLQLDAKGMTIHAITDPETQLPLPYQYDGQIIDITLPKLYSRVETYRVKIDYTAKPDELDVVGGQAITDAKGLYFINADSSEVNKPTQVWTQGQPESNSCWFPTIDSPNERMTQEVFIRVHKNFVTLSNGSLVYSNYNDDNTRTDYWKQDLNHPPYLTMLAAGNFLAAQDTWKRRDGSKVPLSYYLEPEYAPYAWKIFGNTPEMLTFYSDLLGIEYPWDKYSQIVVRDYVSGAMENTTAVIFGEFMNMNDRELLDDTYEAVIAHELFHHWFGDLVTCENWSHLPLNESFATYGEFLWEEHKYGRDAADYQGWESEAGYLYESEFKQLPLIRFDYENPDDMFDAHSYNKGGRVLHLLRETVGDTAFFASLKLYLENNAFKDVELEHLRLAFEEVTGTDLSWFFTQWFEMPGHPELTISYFYDGDVGQQQVVISQAGNANYETPTYRIPLAIDLYFADQSVRREFVTITEEEHLFAFDVMSEPLWVNVDAKKSLLGRKIDQKPADWWARQLTSGGVFRDRQEAMTYFQEVPDVAYYQAIESALTDPFWFIRSQAIDWITNIDSVSTTAAAAILNMAKSDDNTSTRADAIRAISLYPQPSAALNAAELEAFVTQERSYRVNATALEALYLVNPSRALELAVQEAETTPSAEVLIAATSLFIADGSLAHQAFFERKIIDSDGFTRFQLLQQYGIYLGQLPFENSTSALTLLERLFALPLSATWERYAAYNLLGSIRTRIKEEPGSPASLQAESGALVDRLIAAEGNARLLALLQSFL
jgi:aminopeptidase N